MKTKCEYCGNYLDSSKERCPNCGAVNKNFTRGADGVPKSIEELVRYCRDKNMPLAKMRFFIGEDYRGARAFGIYFDGCDYIVYKNLASGERKVRYKGPDEEYAVNEIYQKIREESVNQAAAGNIKRTSPCREAVPKAKTRKSVTAWLEGILDCSFVVSIIALVALIFIMALITIPVIQSFGHLETFNAAEQGTVGEENTGENKDEEKGTTNNIFFWNTYDYAPSAPGTYDYFGYDNYYDSYDYNYDSYDDWNGYDSYDSYNSWGSWGSDNYGGYDSWDSYDSWNSDSWDSNYNYDGWDYNTTDWGSDW